MRIDGPSPVAVLAVEAASQELLDLLDPDSRAQVLISGPRAAALNLANERDAADPSAPVVIGHSNRLNAETAWPRSDNTVNAWPSPSRAVMFTPSTITSNKP